MNGLCLETGKSNLMSVSLTVLELLAFNVQILGGHVTTATPISGAAQTYFLRDVNGKLCSKFGEDRSKTGLTMLAVVAGWTHTLKWIYILYNAIHCIGQTIMNYYTPLHTVMEMTFHSLSNASFLPLRNDFEMPRILTFKHHRETEITTLSFCQYSIITKSTQ